MKRTREVGGEIELKVREVEGPEYKGVEDGKPERDFSKGRQYNIRKWTLETKQPQISFSLSDSHLILA